MDDTGEARAVTTGPGQPTVPKQVAARGVGAVREDVNIHRDGLEERGVNDAKIYVANCRRRVVVNWSQEDNGACKLSSCNHRVLRSRAEANGAGRGEQRVGGLPVYKPLDLVTTRRYAHIAGPRSRERPYTGKHLRSVEIDIQAAWVSSAMALTKRACAELPEPQLAAKVAKTIKAAMANVRGRAFNKRHIAIYSPKGSFGGELRTWDADMVIPGFTRACKFLYW